MSQEHPEADAGATNGDHFAALLHNFASRLKKRLVMRYRRA